MKIRPAFQGALLLGLWICLFTSSLCYGDDKTVEAAGQPNKVLSSSELNANEAAEVNIEEGKVGVVPPRWFFKPPKFPPIPHKILTFKKPISSPKNHPSPIIPEDEKPKSFFKKPFQPPILKKPFPLKPYFKKPPLHKSPTFKKPIISSAIPIFFPPIRTPLPPIRRPPPIPQDEKSFSKKPFFSPIIPKFKKPISPPLPVYKKPPVPAGYYKKP